jgi:DNA-binding transcriptional MerR regulator
MKKKKKYSLNIDTNDIKALRKFFEEHSDYKTHEIACKYGVPVRNVRHWRDKAGIKSKDNSLVKLQTKYKPKVYEKVEDPKIWDNPEWFKKMYIENKYGTTIISKIIGRSQPLVYFRLKKYGIKCRNNRESKKSKNKYYNKEWLIENYCKKKFTLGQLAEIAKVSKYTISNWLVSFGILPHSRSEQIALYYKNKRIQKYLEWNKRTED